MCWKMVKCDPNVGSEYGGPDQKTKIWKPAAEKKEGMGKSRNKGKEIKQVIY